ncbi:HAMP domain-containing protein [Sphingomonas sp. PL-96]|uniref:ATP-binding protein n=1 Tax=Sphingomonas sp. PL-96 TaxID=2887201 RepID=UPI001E572FA2|nr:ATP-binding protein [Sphingomonas sp. PL-96]MCC2976043.1 HAMP domain-containing protein [Sphingomonas sp. PL-96]
MGDSARMEDRRSFTLPTRFVPAIEVGVLAVAVAIATGSYFILAGDAEHQRLLKPPLVALLLVANLIPNMALLVLLGRRAAMRRAARSSLGGSGQLHVRLVGSFSLLASVPMLLVTIFASLLFQIGVEFWFSDRARGMLENAQALATQSYEEMLSYVDNENVAMAVDLSKALNEFGWEIDSTQFTGLFGQDVYQRSLSEGIVFSVGPKGEINALALVNPYDRPLERTIDPAAIAKLKAGAKSVVSTSRERTQSITRIGGTDLFLYAARISGAQEMATRMTRAQAVLADYQALLDRSRSLQLQFNVALLIISLVIVGAAVYVALGVADRLVRPIGDLVDAAQRVAGGDLSARVREQPSRDEVSVLATAFNRMTERLNEQTSALRAASGEAESRRALIEAVMSGVSAGVISVDPNGSVRLVNASAASLLKTTATIMVGRPLGDVAPELHVLLSGDQREAIVQLSVGGESRTLAVRVTRQSTNFILTFDDITQQLLDQRRAAWSDVARRIAHEIKNPLTPIQLAAERLKRRYSRQIENDDGTFVKLTDTIVRQVGDLRRMVDEFSSFARMPKPVFRAESMLDIARQAVFLHEVAHPQVAFNLAAEDAVPPVVCDRRQFGQALTNIVKNAVEAIEARGEGAPEGRVDVALSASEGGQLQLTVSDNGIGLPVERDRIVEPYMTTRVRGTGLGLAIVKKIVEEHFGTITFGDRPGGGTVVTITLDLNVLAALEGEDAGSALAGAEETQRQAMLTRTGTARS